jgi:hypothetical protein
MPQPSSVTRISLTPPSSSCTWIAAAPASTAVFQQFLEHRGGSFDDLAGGDLADQEVGQRFDDAHRGAGEGSADATGGTPQPGFPK